MPNWNDVLQEIHREAQRNPKIDPFNLVRQKYLNTLFNKRGRNIITYYSGWLQKGPLRGTEINDNDKNAFMSVIHGLERENGLDLILHTPGGEVAATESLVDYLRDMFELNIEVFIPQIAMSAGTMIACASKLIHMGRPSNLGPIDPQINGVPAGAVLREFEEAAKDIKMRPETIPLWQAIIGRYHPTLILSCENAIKWSKEIVEKWLRDGMFAGDKKANINKIVNDLSDHERMKAHSRHIGIKEAESIGLKICRLEDNQEIQDLVLTIHHTYMHTLSNTSSIKIVENHKNVGQTVNAIPRNPANQRN